MSKMKRRSLQERDDSDQFLGSTRQYYKAFSSASYEGDIYIFEE